MEARIQVLENKIAELEHLLESLLHFYCNTASNADFDPAVARVQIESRIRERAANSYRDGELY